LRLVGEAQLVARHLVAFHLPDGPGLGQPAETIPHRGELGSFRERGALMPEAVEGEIAFLQREE